MDKPQSYRGNLFIITPWCDLNFFLGLFIILKGKAKCQFADGVFLMSGKIVYIEVKKYLIGNENSGSILVEPGVYFYDFKYELLPSLPESFSGKFGSISYEITAVQDIPWHTDEKCSVPIFVERHNNLPEARHPFVVEKVKKFACFTGNCKITVTLVNGIEYAAGEVIPIKIEYKNVANDTIEQTKVGFKRQIVYTSSRGYKEIEQETIFKKYIVGKESLILTSLNLPSILAKSNESYCKVVTVKYYLNIVSVICGCHRNAKLEIPISIGENYKPIKSPSKWRIYLAAFLMIILMIIRNL